MWHPFAGRGEWASWMWAVDDSLSLSSAYVHWPHGALPSGDCTIYVSCFTDMLWEVLKEFPDKSKGETSNSQIVKVKPLLDYENKFI